MASEYDLRRAARLGADAAIFSGHKFLAGPTAGIVAGRREFMRTVALQGRGIGRITKVGKEGILGAIVALEAWGRRDHEGERGRELKLVEGWMAALAGLPGQIGRAHV